MASAQVVRTSRERAIAAGDFAFRAGSGRDCGCGAALRMTRTEANNSQPAPTQDAYRADRWASGPGGGHRTPRGHGQPGDRHRRARRVRFRWLLHPPPGPGHKLPRPRARDEKVRSDFDSRPDSQQLADLKNQTEELERKLSDARLS